MSNANTRLHALSEALQPHCGIAYVVIQHLAADRETLLDGLIAGWSALSVRLIEEGMTARPDQIYVMPAGRYLTVTGGVFHLSQPEAPVGQQRRKGSIQGDVLRVVPRCRLLRELGETCPEEIVCGNGLPGSRRDALPSSALLALRALIAAADKTSKKPADYEFTEATLH